MHVAAHLNIDVLAHNTDEEVTCLVNLQAPVPPQSATRPGQTLCVVLDRSGSMFGEPLDSAKDAISALVRRLAPQDAFGLIVFDHQAAVVSPVRLMADHHLPSLQDAIASIDSGGSTDISAGYMLALREVKRSLDATGQRGGTVLIVSDGEANAGIQEPAKLDELALNAFRSHNITTSTLGLGRHYSEVALTALTHGGNGEHRFAPTAAEAVAEITTLVGDLLDKSVVGAHLRISHQPGLVSHVLLRNEVVAYMDAGAVVVALGDMYANEERSVLVKFVVPSVAALGVATIADIVVEYTTMPDLTEQKVTLPIAVNVVPGDDARGRIPNPVVEVAELLADLAEEKKTASESLRRGDSASAQRTVAGSIRKVRDKRVEVQANPAATPGLTEQLDAAAKDLLQMADDLKRETVEYNSKMMMEAYSAESRGRQRRARPVIDPDEE